MKADEVQVRATSVAGMSKMFAISEPHIRRAIREGELKVSRCGRRVVIFIADAEAWIRTSDARPKERRSA